jgi:hypothetical protein
VLINNNNNNNNMNKNNMNNNLSDDKYDYWFEIKFRGDPDKTFVVTHDFLIKLENNTDSLYDSITHLNYCNNSDDEEKVNYDYKLRKIKHPKALINFSCEYPIFNI